MTEQSNIGEQYGLGAVDVPEGHQATLRPVEGSDTPQVSIEPVPADPQPDASDPIVQAGLDAHAAAEADAAAAFRAEHDAQLQARHDAEIAAAGKPANIGDDGKPHFLRMKPLASESNPAEPSGEFEEVCGTCETEWPCEQAQAIEQRAAEARGEQPAQIEPPAE